jgi:Uma2 family endonuclease
MIITKDQKNPQQLRLNITNANLHITPEQFERLCTDNPDLKLELTNDGQLLIVPPEVVDGDNHSTPQAGSSVKYDLPALTPEETARRVAVVKRFTERKQQLWDSLTPQEKADNDAQFEELHRLLEESRR